jgi:hypothetical protein
MKTHAIVQVHNPMKEVMARGYEYPMNMDTIHYFIKRRFPKLDSN